MNKDEEVALQILVKIKALVAVEIQKHYTKKDYFWAVPTIVGSLCVNMIGDIALSVGKKEEGIRFVKENIAHLEKIVDELKVKEDG